MVAAVAFKACQPLKLNGSKQIIVLEQCGARVMNTGVSREDELRHLFNALSWEWRETAFRRSVALPLERYAPFPFDPARLVLGKRRSRWEFVLPRKRPTGIDDRFR